jgi:hypothetical protein
MEHIDKRETHPPIIRRVSIEPRENIFQMQKEPQIRMKGIEMFLQLRLRGTQVCRKHMQMEVSENTTSLDERKERQADTYSILEIG